MLFSPRAAPVTTATLPLFAWPSVSGAMAGYTLVCSWGRDIVKVAI